MLVAVGLAAVGLAAAGAFDLAAGFAGAGVFDLAGLRGGDQLLTEGRVQVSPAKVMAGPVSGPEQLTADSLEVPLLAAGTQVAQQGGATWQPQGLPLRVVVGIQDDPA